MSSTRSDQMFANVCSYAHCKRVLQKVLAASIHKNRTKTTAERCQKMHRRGGLSYVRCSPILAVYFYLLCRSIHSSQTALISVASECGLTFSSQLRQSQKFPNRGHSTTKSGRSAVGTLVEQVLRDVCRFVSAT